MTVEDVHTATHRIDRWFLQNIKDIVAVEERLRALPHIEDRERDPARTRELLLEAKQHGFSDRQLATLWFSTETEVRRLRQSFGIVPVYKRVDTCAAEFEAYTPYYYSTYEAPVTEVRGQRSEVGKEVNATGPGSLLTSEDETRPPSGKQRIMILGGGPNRIGQGIEFDYCCCQA